MTAQRAASYYFLRQDLFDATDIIEITGHTEETGKRFWTLGVRFEEDLPVETLELDPEYGETLPDFFDTTVPVMSPRLLQALAKAGVDNLDTYPVVLRRTDTGEEWRDYRAVNVIGSLDAIDRGRSECVETEIGSLDCESIVIDPAVAEDRLCFRLAEGPGLIVVHEKVADAVRAQNFVAVLLQKTEDYDGD